MKKTKENEGADQLNVQVPALWLDELERSYYVLESIIASIPSDMQRELIELLQVLAKDGKSQKLPILARQKALEIMTEVYKEDQPFEEIAQYESELRASEQRQRDRRQQTFNSGSPWTAKQIRILQTLAEQNIPIRRIALKLGRTSTAVQSKAKGNNIPLTLIKNNVRS